MDHREKSICSNTVKDLRVIVELGISFFHDFNE